MPKKRRSNAKAGKAKAKAKKKQNEATKQQQLLEEQIEQLQIGDDESTKAERSGTAAGQLFAADGDEEGVCEADDMMCCASCGIKEDDEEIKLQNCDGCQCHILQDFSL